MRRTLGALRARFGHLLHLDDPPWRVALALAVGVFISCTPFYFFQTLLAVLVAGLVRLNVPATVLGTWLNLPWFAPFVYAGALKVGAHLVPSGEGLSGLSIALLVGTTVVGAAAAVLTWMVAAPVIAWRRRRRRARRDADRTSSHAA
jgi:uncharacterized protein (DUF2062 family)